MRDPRPLHGTPSVIFVFLPAQTDSHGGAPATEPVERANGFGHDDGVVQREQRQHGSELDTRGRARHYRLCGGGVEEMSSCGIGVMGTHYEMLRNEQTFESEPISRLRDSHDIRPGEGEFPAAG